MAVIEEPLKGICQDCLVSCLFTFPFYWGQLSFTLRSIQVIYRSRQNRYRAYRHSTVLVVCDMYYIGRRSNRKDKVYLLYIIIYHRVIGLMEWRFRELQSNLSFSVHFLHSGVIRRIKKSSKNSQNWL